LLFWSSCHLDRKVGADFDLAKVSNRQRGTRDPNDRRNDTRCFHRNRRRSARTASLEKKEAPEQSAITIKIATGLACTTALGTDTFSATTYSFGATQDTSTTSTGTGSGTGKSTVMPLNATKLFDECSPSLFGAVVTGKHFASVDLTQNDGKGHTILTINLQNALISSYQIGGSQSSDSPRESIQIDFQKICISEPSNGSKLCFDRTTNTTF
jgi:type VI protein secretion system component Hcp